MAVSATIHGSLLGWVLAIAIDGAILVAFAWVTAIVLQGTNRFLVRRTVGNGVGACVMAVTALVCFVGAWLPIGAVLFARRIWRLI